MMVNFASYTMQAAQSVSNIEAKGKLMSDSDLMIYAVCVSNDEVLVAQDKTFGNLKSERIKIVE